MRYLISLIAILTFSFTLDTQVFQQRFEKEFNRSVSEFFFGNEDRQFYLDYEGRFTLINTPTFLQVYNPEGDLVLERDHIKKTSKFLSNLTKSATSFSLEEGSSFMIFNEEGILLVMDYTVKENLLIAFDLENGEELWRREDLRYTSTKDDQMASMIQNVMIQNVGNQVNNQLAMASLDNPVFAHVTFESSEAMNPGGVIAQSYIAPLPGTGKFILKAGDELVCLNVENGEENWRYGERPLTLAYHEQVSENEMVIVSYSANALKKNERDMVLIDINNGQEQWHNTYISNFVSGQSYVAGGNLYLDFYGLEAYDLNTGELIITSLDEGTLKTNNALTGGLLGGGEAPEETAMTVPSFVGKNNDYIYTYHRLSFNKKYGYHGAAKPVITKYNTETGEAVWSTDKLLTQTRILDETETSLILKMPKGLNRFYMALLDKETGKITKESEKLKDYFFGSAPGVFFSDKLAFVGIKDGLMMYRKQDLKKISEIDTRSSSIGKLQTTGLHDDEIFFIGNKGIAFYDQEGQLKRETEIKRIGSALWNNENILVFTKNETIAVPFSDISSHDMLEITPFDEDYNILFSDNIRYMVSIEDEKEMAFYEVGL